MIEQIKKKSDDESKITVKNTFEVCGVNFFKSKRVLLIPELECL